MPNTASNTLATKDEPLALIANGLSEDTVRRVATLHDQGMRMDLAFVLGAGKEFGGDVAQLSNLIHLRDDLIQESDAAMMRIDSIRNASRL